jgi:phosphotriesterase-related protein
MKNIDTVQGTVSTENMGITLMHEHVFNNYPYYKEKENTDFALKQLTRLHRFNVKTIVDLTPYAKVGSYKKLIEQCDINIICAIGFFLDKFVPSSYKTISVSDLVEKLSRKIEVGIGENRYKPGIVKIAANSPNLNDRQLRFFEVAAILQNRYKIPIATHSPHGGLEHLEILIQMGAIPSQLYLSHLENEINDKVYDAKMYTIQNIMSKQANIVLTNFGITNKSDRHKGSIKLISYLRENNYLQQTLISADSNWRWKSNILRLRDSQFKGAEKTSSYVFDFIIPALKKAKFTDSDIGLMLINNPKRIFDF